MTDKETVYGFRNYVPISFTFVGDSHSEILKIAEDGFYVRGVKLEQDEHEARKVYEAFRDWLKEMGKL